MPTPSPLDQLRDPKNRPVLFAGVGTAMVVTMIFTSCLCCGVISWLFPSSPTEQEETAKPLPAEVASLPEDENQTAESGQPKELKNTAEQFDAMAEAAKRKRDLSAVKEALRGHSDLPALSPANFEFNQMGSVEWPARIVQVIDERNMLVSITRRTPRRRNDLPERMTIWVADISTDHFVDDTSVTLKGGFVVAGKKQYQTVSGGGKTVFVLRQIDPAVMAQARKELVYLPTSSSPDKP